ncbi:PAS domain-containing hybrid sensor histidine kinase/response regulator [Alteromonas stellipolaris]|uniref:PAS domain-containing hybrid sensor histidine kinase/response regulator n=1 Tax=Alteromonas stellipolaris TaxID=233316 RepID=UPI001DE6E1F8|nr:PAS domain-containing hybrid sensor histidine kinase/response regulator [Alteromonas stellipolaris]MBZ2163651.1 response regulator [Alteromonas stellipolaris]
MSIIKDLHQITTDGALSFSDKIDRLLEIGTKVLGLETGIVSYVHNENYTVVQVVSPLNEIEVGAEFPLSDTYCADTLHAKGIVAYKNVDVMPGNSHPCYALYTLKSYLATPIYVNASLYGTLNFSSTSSKYEDFSALDYDYLLLLADWIGAEVAREQALSEIISQKNALEEQNALLNQITELAGVGTWELDLEMNSLKWSASLKRMLQINEKQEITPSRALQFMANKKVRNVYESKMEEITTTGNDWAYEFEVITDAGEKRWLESRAHPIMKNGTCQKIIGATRDITERFNTTQSLKQKTAIAEQALKARSEFLANMSHEIRTPIHGVQGMLETLCGTSLNEKQKEYTHVAMRSSESLLNIVNDILDFSKIDSGHMTYDAEPVNLKELIEQQVQMFRRLADKKGIEFITETAAVSDTLFLADSLRLSQILMNLINNAVKFTEEGSIKISTRCTKYGAGRYRVKLIITDTGIGISEEQQKVIFSPFLQAEESTQRRFGGTGLGLAIVSNIVEHYDGNVEVSSAVGEGARFIVTMTLDCANAGTLKEKIIADNNTAPLCKRVLSESRVLVVEDNEINQIVIKEQLKEIGVSVELANNGALGLAKVKSAIARKKPYDLIFMDCHMPVMDGLMATKEIRVLDEKIPIIALTANALSGEKEKCLRAGMDDFISKPVGVSRLGDCINYHLSNKQERFKDPA